MYEIEEVKFMNSEENIKFVSKTCSPSRLICILPKNNKSINSIIYKNINAIEKIFSHFKTTSRFIILITSEKIINEKILFIY